jgi:hypothetical protein
MRLTILAFLLCGSQHLACAAGKQTEIVLISTEHFMSDQIGDTSPAHLRAMLNRVRPDVLALEALANASDPFSQLPFEAWNITLPWARENNVATQAVDGTVANYQQALGIMVQRLSSGPHAAEYQKLENTLAAELAQWRGFEQQQQDRFHDCCRRYWTQIRTWAGGETAWDQRGAIIAANILKLAAESAGKRIAVVFGAMHGHDLSDRLVKHHELKLVPAAQFLPLPAQEIVAAMKPADDLLAMRRLNFQPGASIVGKLDGIEKPLQRLAASKVTEPVARHYQARLLMHRFQWQEALKLLDELAAQPTDLKLAIPGNPPAVILARINRAIVLQVLQRADEARAELDAVIADPLTQGELRPFAEQLRKGMSAPNKP